MLAKVAGVVLLAGMSAGEELCQKKVMYSSRRPGNANLPHQPVSEPSTQDCSNRCLNTRNCRCFSFNSGRNHCWLMSSCQTRSEGHKFRVFSAGRAGCRDPEHVVDAKPLFKETQPAECQLGHSDAQAGMKVYRGSSWRWGNQDGGFGHEGELIGMADACPKGAWWRVHWKKTGIKNVYRVGCSGKHDLRMADCGQQEAETCDFNSLYWPAGAVPTGDFGCQRDGRVKIGHSCKFVKEGSTCEAPACVEYSNYKVAHWSTKQPACVSGNATKEEEKEEKPAEEPAAGESDNRGVLAAEDGAASCAHELGETCDSCCAGDMQCGDGTCRPGKDPCGADCRIDAGSDECMRCCLTVRQQKDWKCSDSEQVRCCSEWSSPCYHTNTTDNNGSGCVYSTAA
eukprot:TRINITY_DN6243_c0_g2_i2.p2 TRINITY_DN6243_c0_g2~~TRINITY_DN6243_c0_g2_i2.p2  ORF type:complete len:397 (+),score=132.50 TRINITY_DN6243_c0_g2_i2:94-1284(+)